MDDHTSHSKVKVSPTKKASSLKESHHISATNRDPVTVKSPSAKLDVDKRISAQLETRKIRSKMQSSQISFASTTHDSKNQRPKTNIHRKNDTQVPASSKSISKSINQVNSSPNKSNTVDSSTIKETKKISHDERVVGGSKNVSAIFGNKIDECSSLSAVLVKQARQSGQLNLSNRGISSIPDKVYRINDLDEEEQKNMKKGLSLDRVGIIKL